ncbi:30S ribosomal protein S8 [Candidatus Peregrinibacteria bacterium]|nr:30S ribosomal protein S8 [Candidatus Peregrinibacteria bacterium]
MYTDPIADLLIRIKNAARARKEHVSAPYSKVKENILANLKKKHFIQDFTIEAGEKAIDKSLKITINNDRRDIEVKRISKPGQRIYIKSSEIKKINGGLGLAIISTPKGIVSGEEAKKLNLGGELICEVF